MFTLRNKYLLFLMWLLPLSFFSYQFILRLWPSLMMQQIMHQFAIDATSFGLLASLYYFGYAGMQIPIAIMLDRFGAHRVLFVCTLVCGFSTFAFTYTDNWFLALCSRFLIGASSAVGFLGTSKVVSVLFSKANYSRMIGFTFTIGLMGAIYGGKPLNLLLEHYNWQSIALYVAMVAIAIGTFSYIFLGKFSETDNNKEQFKLADFKQLLHNKKIWFLAISNLLMVGSLEGFADVWGVNYLMTSYHLNKSDAAELISFIFIGMLFGGPFLAYLSKRLGNCFIISISGIGMSLLFCLLIANVSTNWYWLMTLFFLIGIMCCYQVIVFALGVELVEQKLMGVTIAFLNCINMLGGSFFHSTIGGMMDLFWTGKVDNYGIKQYTIESYNYALSVIPTCAILGASMVLVIAWNMARIKQERRAYT